MKYAVAVANVAAHREQEISLHILEAANWRAALNQSPSVWWRVPSEQRFEEAQHEAKSLYGCLIAVKQIDDWTPRP